MYMSDFSTRLKELREEKELTQRQLAAEIKTSQANVSRWEKGAFDPSTEWLIALAKFFGVSIDYLLGVTDS